MAAIKQSTQKTANNSPAINTTKRKPQSRNKKIFKKKTNPKISKAAKA